MNNFNKLERKFGQHAIKNLMLYLTVLYTIGFVIYLVNPALYGTYLALDAGMIIHKLQIWRVVTWLMYPPNTSALFGILMLYLYYMLGNSLENVMGSFKFNCFIIGGIILYIVVAFVIYLIWGISIHFTPDSLNLTIFLAFVFAFPDAVFLLFFIIPVRGKVIGIFYIILTAVQLLTSSWPMRIQILIALLNFVIFFYGYGMAKGFKQSNIIRQERFKEALKKRSEEAAKMKPQSSTFHHKCTICGKTDIDDPEMEFRYCSKCGGNYEYCMEHLFNHTHRDNG